MSTRTGPRNATTARGGSRFYTWRGERYPSVTTIIKGGVPAPALQAWGMREVATCAVNGIERLRKRIEEDGSDGAIAWLKEQPYRISKKAADAGTDLHAAAEAYVLGQPWPEPTDPDVVLLLAHFKRFHERYQPVYEATEASVYNRRWGYAGTLDAIATIDGRKLLIDIKTAKSADKGPYPEHALQLNAYKNAEFIGLPDGSEAPMPAVDGCAVLHIAPECYRLIEVRTDEAVFQSFLYALQVHRYLTEIAKTVIGREIPAPSTD